MSGTHGICWISPDAGHDGGDDVLFDSEWSRVERDTEDGNPRHVTSPQLEHREGQQQRDILVWPKRDSAKGIQPIQTGKTNRVNIDGRISEEEEAVDTRKDDGPNETDNPSAESRRRHCRIIGIGNRRPDFNIW